MTLKLPHRTALLLVDIQQGFSDPVWGRRNNPQAEGQAGTLLRAWRILERPIVHVQHRSVEPDSPLRPGQSGVEFQQMVAPEPGEPVFTKSVNSAFIGTNLETYLRHEAIDHIVIAGLTTNHCVETTTRMAGNLGFHTYLVEDASATFDRTGPHGTVWSAATIHAVTLANLHEEFATIVTTAGVLTGLK